MRKSRIASFFGKQGPRTDKKSVSPIVNRQWCLGMSSSLLAVVVVERCQGFVEYGHRREGMVASVSAEIL